MRTAPLTSIKERPTAVDLFAGAGGMTRGLRDANFDVLAAIEVDPLAAETYRLNHPETLLVERDIRKIDAPSFAAEALQGGRTLDVLAACPPCQGFSTVRTLRGKAVRDPRNRLIGDLIRFVDALRPRVVLFENVPGVESDWRFRELVRNLRKRRYAVRSRVDDAADYGVPQRRLRLLMVASLNADIDLAPATPGTRTTVRAAFSRLERFLSSDDPLHHYGERRAEHVAHMIRAVPKDGGSRHDLPSAMRLECHKRMNGFYDVYGRMRWDDVAPTITGSCINPSKGRFLHPEEDRAITLREAAALQSFPPDYRFSLRRGRYACAQMIGNAFPPAVVRAQAEALKKYL